MHVYLLTLSHYFKVYFGVTVQILLYDALEEIVCQARRYTQSCIKFARRIHTQLELINTFYDHNRFHATL